MMRCYELWMFLCMSRYYIDQNIHILYDSEMFFLFSHILLISYHVIARLLSVLVFCNSLFYLIRTEAKEITSIMKVITFC